MGAAVVRVRKSKAKRQALSDAVDERKSSNCPFIPACEILWKTALQSWMWDGIETVLSPMNRDSNSKGGMSNKREGVGRKETFDVLYYSSCVSLPPLLSSCL